MALLSEDIKIMNPANGQNLTMADSDVGNFMIIAPATDLATLTLTFPTNPGTGNRVGVVFTRNIASLSLAGGSFNYLPGKMPAGGYMFFRYDPSNNTWMDTGHDNTYQLIAAAALMRGKNFDVTTTGGTAIIYLTTNGLSTGPAMFETIDFVNARFVSNDPNFGVSYTLTNSNKTLTLTAVKQAFTGITLLSTNILGSVAISPAADGTALKVYVQGKLNP